MHYVQNTDADRKAMLATIGVDSIDDLMAQIPEGCRFEGELDVGPALTEDELVRHMKALASRNVSPEDRPSFLGAGAYRHFCPAMIDHLMYRTEFWTAYTPYQPEASQGTLRTILEWQTMMTRLTGTGVCNASMYDGATAVVEAVMMALRIQRNTDTVVVSKGLHPDARGCLATYLRSIDVTLIEVDLVDGRTPADAIPAAMGDSAVAAVAIQSPNVYGVVEDIKSLADAAHDKDALCVVAADPVSMSLLEAPGKLGADMVCGEATGMGNPPWFGGPGVGYLCGRMDHVRQMPARIAGETTDHDGNRAVVLTFQTREQHIRRTKATSNICTSQQLMALRATIWMTLLGKEGFVELGKVNLSRAHHAAQRIAALDGYELAFPGSHFFNEFTIRTPIPALEVNRRLLEEHGIIGGFNGARIAQCAGASVAKTAGAGNSAGTVNGTPLADDHLLIVAVTDVNTPAEIDKLVAALETIR